MMRTFTRRISQTLLLMFLSLQTAWGTQYFVAVDSEVESLKTANSYTSSSSDYGRSWMKPMTLVDALAKAVSGDYIFVKGYDDDFNHVYTVPSVSGFVLKTGVKLYGGFKGTEVAVTTTADDGTVTQKVDVSVLGKTGDPRVFADGKLSRMAYRSTLNGDINDDDQVHQSMLIYPENSTRDDNATHVLTISLAGTGTDKTVVNGFAIFGGDASGNTEADQHGGGIYVTTASGVTSTTAPYEISQCFMSNNYARKGGAIYVDATVKGGADESVINLNSLMNNVAGSRGGNSNEGGGVYMAGEGTVVNCVIYNNVNGGVRLSGKGKVINCTICRNTEGGIDLVSSSDKDGATVANTVFWGNTTLSTSTDLQPNFSYCAYYYTDGTNGNVKIISANISEKESEKDNCAYFEYPSTYTSFDRTYDWRTTEYPYWSWYLDERSALVCKGTTKAYSTANYGNRGIGGTTRFTTINGESLIDIGACECEQILTGRRLYVTSTGGGKQDGSSWDNAMSSIQSAIDKLHTTDATALGEVWVAGSEAGTVYEVSTRVSEDNSPISLRMYDGISVYGGFKGDETRKRDRVVKTGGMSWEYQYQTIIRAKGFSQSGMKYSDGKWSFSSSESCHVVWFAPLPADDGTVGSFTNSTTLDGFTIEGGSTGTSSMEKYSPQRGTGVFMTENTYLHNCVVRNCNAIKATFNEVVKSPEGGGVYCRGGQITSTLVYNCTATDGSGGGIYVDGQGAVSRSMITNNTAETGSGVYLNYDETISTNRYYQILSSSVITNNTATKNGAVYANQGGVVEQNTIANNYGSMTTDNTETEPAKTGGLYVSGTGVAVNNILWNNIIKSSGQKSDALTDGLAGVSKAQIFAGNTTSKTVTFYSNALSDKNFTVWNYINQSNTLSLSSSVSDALSYFKSPTSTANMADLAALNTTRGVQEWQTIDYYWPTADGTQLTATGLSFGLFPEGVILKPELDPEGNAYNSSPSIGAYETSRPQIVPAFISDSGDYTQAGTLRVYVEAALNNMAGDGSTWANNYQSCNDAMAWLATLTAGTSVTVYNPSDGKQYTHTMQTGDQLEVCLREGDLHPRYTASNNDAQSATVAVPATSYPLTLKGGYPAYEKTSGMSDDDINAMRDPVTYRSEVNGNNDGVSLSTGLYHVMRVSEGADFTLDGVVVSHGYAAGTASIPRGGGMLITGDDTGSTPTNVELRNCIFEHNTALYGAAISVETVSKNVIVNMENCVVNNNTCLSQGGDTFTKTRGVNGSETSSVSDWLVNLGESGTNKLTTLHCTFVNNYGIVPETMTTGTFEGQPDATREGTSFAVGNKIYGTNSTDNVHNTFTEDELASVGAAGAANFANPTNAIGAQINSNTYFGGNADYRPLTSGAQSGSLLINTATTSSLTQDIAGNDRDLGGAEDLGAYEADLPKSGKIIYVRDYGNTTDTGGDGSSWDKAINGNCASYGSHSQFQGYDVEIYAAGTTVNGLQWAVDEAFYRSLKKSNGSVTYGTKRVYKMTSGTYGGYNNIAVSEIDTTQQVQVWIAEGEYLNSNGYFMRDGVDVYGGFPKDGNPGEDDRNPKTYISILETNKTGSYTYGTTYSDKDFRYNYSSQYDLNWYTNAYKTQRVLTQQFPYYGGTNVGDMEKVYNDNILIGFNRLTTWNGFTIRNGRTQVNHQRDGGAGVAIRYNGKIENCVIDNNINRAYYQIRAGGVFCNNGTIVNCVISNNQLNNPGSTSFASTNLYGGGLYMRAGTVYNTVIVGNTCQFLNSSNSYDNGAGVFFENGYFYNNTVSGNVGTSAMYSGNWFSYGRLYMYNTIIYGNTNSGGKDFDTSSNTVDMRDCLFGTTSSYGSNVGSYSSTFVIGDPKFTDASNGDYSLSEGSPAINTGLDLAQVNVSTPAYDAAYTDRIKDCTIDIGAYEYDNLENITPQMATVDGTTTATFYVTQTGFGTRSGSSPENAACAEKLQKILTKAGELYAADADGSKKTYIVKVAGYTAEEGGFVYHANTKANDSAPQSYTFLIPNGVTLMGGYYEGDQTTSGTKTTLTNYDWDDDLRDIYSRPTRLSAVAQESNRDVNGYHTVMFGSWPSDTEDINEWNKTAVADGAMIDGCWLEDGLATGGSGHKGMGGGALVPLNAHVRNCVITGNEATQGGGVYLLHGGIASGCLIKNNEATVGAGAYCSNGGVDGGDGKTYAYLVSSTIVRNEASSDGGGIYFEDGSAMFGNDIIWGNTAQSDNNISGIVNVKYQNDNYDMTSIGGATKYFYPFNDCFVETYQMPANTRNTEMSSDLDDYFNGEDEWLPRVYSVLVHHGIGYTYQGLWEQTGHVSSHDMTGTARRPDIKGVSRLTAGAFAVNQAPVDYTNLVTRLFVAQNGGANASDEEMAKNIGRSFYTPFSSLDGALEYIRQVRTTTDGNGSYIATEATQFEILMAEGTYSPGIRRTDANTSSLDLRQNSFVIPVNVRIYGGFLSTDKYTSGGLTTLSNVSGLIETTDEDNNVVGGYTMDKILEERNTRDRMQDLNGNGLYEPWELGSTTVLSGDVQSAGAASRVYHVLYSTNNIYNSLGQIVATAQAENCNVLLDGLTIMDGYTSDSVNVVNGSEAHDEVGHGAGLYAKGVNFVINRCRLRDNTAVHGGAIFMSDATLITSNTLFTGNKAYAPANASELTDGTISQYGQGGAVCMTSDGNNYYAVHTVYANNEVEGAGGLGGAVAVQYKSNSTGTQKAIGRLMNCMVVRNKADKSPSFFVQAGTNIDLRAVNTIFWGNEGETSLNSAATWYSASDLPNYTAYNTDDETSHHNVQLSTANMAANGPRFTEPSTVAGVAGYKSSNKWNPTALSVLTDAGTGMIPYVKNVPYTDAAHTTVSTSGEVKVGEHEDWWSTYSGTVDDYKVSQFKEDYIQSANSTNTYNRYMGTRDELNMQQDKVIDIGLYEYQFPQNFATMDLVYIGTYDSGLADGSSWDNQSSDLYGAIVGLSHPESSGTTEQVKTIYVSSGQYFFPVNGSYVLNMTNTGLTDLVKELVIKGSCSRQKDASDEEIQDFSQPTELIQHPAKNAPEAVLTVTTSNKTVTIEGLQLVNDSVPTNITGTNYGKGLKASVDNVSGKLNVRNSSFVNNSRYGVELTQNQGRALFYNTLFANNQVAGLSASGSNSTVVVNATFGRNQTDITSGSNTDVYNSVAWSDNTAHTVNLVATGSDTYKTDDHNNVGFKPGTANLSVLNGPNFTDPVNMDYTLRPSQLLLNKGSNDNYKTQVLAALSTDASATFTDSDVEADVDLASQSRLVDGNIDVGAYEYQSVMKQILYVKSGVVGGDGSSWSSPLSDLQSAADQAGLFAENVAGTHGYVLVDKNFEAKNGLTIGLSNIKVFGTFDNQIYTGTSTDAATIVADILAQRKGILTETSMSKIDNLTITYEGDDANHEDDRSVVDGFYVNGTVAIDAGMLSTSVVDADVSAGDYGEKHGWIYNSLVLGDVDESIENVVNVTASGTINGKDNRINNRDEGEIAKDGLCRYVSDKYWEYQLNEDDKCTRCLDSKGSVKNSAYKRCKALAGHGNDLAGNLRERGAKIDYGCFETWNIAQADGTITESDYPHGRSVVYVRKGLELAIDKGVYQSSNIELKTFNPGYILLEHHAGLRGNGNIIRLDNFSVERDLKAGQEDLVSLPFDVHPDITGLDSLFTMSRYDGETRATVGYEFSSTNGAWQSANKNRSNYSEGFLLLADKDFTARFNGGTACGAVSDYTEDGSYKLVELVQHNNNEAWDSGTSSSKKFTDKEHMGWNLFGSPFLCSMNYSEMEYGRVLYGFVDGTYQTLNTISQTEGHIPALDGLLTQTATLKAQEQFIVNQPSESKSGTEYEGRASVSLALTRSVQTRSLVETGTDVLQLNAVPTSEARTDYSIDGDGVKWMAASNVPQIYAMRGSGRYSMLSAVDINGSVGVGVTVAEAGTYTIALPDDSNTDGYDCVVLTDNQTGTRTNLMESAYDFTVEKAGDVQGRFTVSFSMGGNTLPEAGIKAWSSQPGTISVSGLEQDDVVTVYTAAGVLLKRLKATTATETIEGCNAGVAIVNVVRDGQSAAVKKIRVK